MYSPFELLTRHLQIVFQQKGSISIPPELASPFRTGNVSFGSDYLAAFCKVFNGNANTKRLRLDASSLIVIFSISLQLPQSLSKDRLLFAFMETIRDLTNETEAAFFLSKCLQKHVAVEDVRRYREEVTNSAIQNLLHCLTTVDSERELKRIASQFLCSIIRGDLSIRRQIAKDDSICAVLGQTLLEASDRVLQIILVHLIREIVSKPMDLETFWPKENYPNITLSWSMFKGKNRFGLNRMLEHFVELTKVQSKEAISDRTLKLKKIVTDDASLESLSEMIVVLSSTSITIISITAESGQLQIRTFPLLPNMMIFVIKDNIDPDSGPIADISGHAKDFESSVLISYERNTGYQILEGSKTAIAEFQIFCFNQKDEARLVDLVQERISCLIAFSDGGVSGKSRSRRPSTRSSVAFVAIPDLNDYEWWPIALPNDNHDSIPETVKNRIHIKSDILRAAGHFGHQSPDSSVNGMMQDESASDLNAVTPKEVANSTRPLGASTIEEGTTPGYVRANPQLQAPNTIDSRNEKHFPRENSVNEISIRFEELRQLSRDALLLCQEPADQDNLSRPTEKAALSPLTPNPIDHRAADDREEKLVKPNGVSRAMARLNQDICQDNHSSSPKNGPIAEKNSQKQPQAKLKRRSPHSQITTDTAEVDWDEGLREDSQPAAKKRKETKKNGKRNVPKSAVKGKESTKQSQSKRANLKGKEQPQSKSEDSIQSIAATRSRRALPPKPAKYVEDIDTDQSDEESQEIDTPSAPQKASRSPKTHTSKLPQLAKDSIQVRDSQPKDKFSLKQAGVDTVNSSEHSEFPLGSNSFEYPAVHNSSMIDQDVDADKALPTRNEGIVRHQERNGSNSHVVDFQMTEEVVEDSHPKEQTQRQEIPTGDNQDLGFRMNEHISSSSPLHPTIREAPKTPFGNPASFVNDINSAQREYHKENKSNTLQHHQPPVKTNESKESRDRRNETLLEQPKKGRRQTISGRTQSKQRNIDQSGDFETESMVENDPSANDQTDQATGPTSLTAHSSSVKTETETPAEHSILQPERLNINTSNSKRGSIFQTRETKSHSRLSHRQTEFSVRNIAEAGSIQSPSTIQTPVAARVATSDQSTILTDEKLQRKTQIVHFELNGPQNQGTLSAGVISRNPPPNSYSPQYQSRQDLSQMNPESESIAFPPELSQIQIHQVESQLEHDRDVVQDDSLEHRGRGSVTPIQTEPAGFQDNHMKEADGPISLSQHSSEDVEASSGNSGNVGNNESEIERSPAKQSSSDSYQEPDQSEYQDDSEEPESLSEGHSSMSAEVPTKENRRKPPDDTIFTCTSKTSQHAPAFEPKFTNNANGKSLEGSAKPMAASRDSLGKFITEIYPTASARINPAALKAKLGGLSVARLQIMMPPPVRPASVKDVSSKVTLDRSQRKTEKSRSERDFSGSANPERRIEAIPVTSKFRIKPRTGVSAREQQRFGSSPIPFSLDAVVDHTVISNYSPYLQPNTGNIDSTQSKRRSNDNTDSTLVGYDFSWRDIKNGTLERRSSPSVDSSEAHFIPPRLGNREDKRPNTTKATKKGTLRPTQLAVRDSMINLTDKLLLQLQNEEEAIIRKVEMYRSGGTSALTECTNSYSDVVQYERKRLSPELDAVTKLFESTAEKVDEKRQALTTSLKLDNLQQVIETKKQSLLRKLEAENKAL